MEAEDAYYQCDDAFCTNEPIEGSTETSQDWEAYLTDDDPYNPFCTEFETSSTDNGYTMSLTYACQEIRCAYRRLLDTGDYDYDF
jgi:hypothetical protein